jgi:hypothetical protein
VVLTHRNMTKAFLSTGADGRVCTWDVRDGTLSDASLKSTLQLEPKYGGATKAPVVRALCVSPLDRGIMVGTSACDIWEVKDENQVCVLSLFCSAASQ